MDKGLVVVVSSLVVVALICIYSTGGVPDEDPSEYDQDISALEDIDFQPGLIIECNYSGPEGFEDDKYNNRTSYRITAKDGDILTYDCTVVDTPSVVHSGTFDDVKAILLPDSVWDGIKDTDIVGPRSSTSAMSEGGTCAIVFGTYEDENTGLIYDYLSEFWFTAEDEIEGIKGTISITETDTDPAEGTLFKEIDEYRNLQTYRTPTSAMLTYTTVHTAEYYGLQATYDAFVEYFSEDGAVADIAPDCEKHPGQKQMKVKGVSLMADVLYFFGNEDLEAGLHVMYRDNTTYTTGEPDYSGNSYIASYDGLLIEIRQYYLMTDDLGHSKTCEGRYQYSYYYEDDGEESL